MKVNLGLRKGMSYLILFTSILLISCSNKEDDNTSVENLLIGTWVHSDLVEGYTEKYVFYEGGNGKYYYWGEDEIKNGGDFGYHFNRDKLVIEDEYESIDYVIDVNDNMLKMSWVSEGKETISTVFYRE